MALKNKDDGMVLYSSLLNDIKRRVRQAQVRATFAANSEMISMYWDIGCMIHFRQLEEGWSASVIPKLSRDLNNDLAETKGFSTRNLARMLAFYRAYEDLDIIMPQPVAQLRKGSKMPRPVAKIKDLLLNIQWGHHALLMEKVKDINLRFWYMEQCIQNGWNRDDLGLMIKSAAHERQGKASTNFNLTLPAAESEMAKQSLKDPYIFDFLTLRETFDEREFETGLVTHIEKFLLELGAGFAFVGRQYHLEVSEKDYYLDLLFYHLKLRCFIVIELKKGEFKPEYAGKMNFYCSAVDDLLKHKSDKPTIGLILCQSRDKILAEYALRDINKPIGVSEFELTRALPKNLKSSLPSIEDIEAEFGSVKEAGDGDE